MSIYLAFQVLYQEYLQCFISFDTNCIADINLCNVFKILAHGFFLKKNLNNKRNLIVCLNNFFYG